MTKPSTPHHGGVPAEPAPGSRGGAPRALQIALLLLACLAVCLLVAEHFGAMALPGCGPESACARAAASAFGRLPGTTWPVSFAGAAWFFGVLAWRLVSGGAPPTLLRLAIRASALASVAYVGLMIVGGYLCPYCLVVHGANLAFLVVLERTPTGEAARSTTLAVPLVVGLLVSVGLGVADASERERQEARQEAELEASTARIVETIEQGSASSTDAHTSGQEPSSAAAVFTGRWPLGPERAAVRVVVFSDYQCPDCRRVEFQLREIEKLDASVSLSMKHYPMCSDCNRFTFGQNPHPNACWAARAAESAGMLGGASRFHAMHRWLFDVQGKFTNDELAQQVDALGLDGDEFKRTMEGAESLARVQADIDEARGLGIHFTPMVFINGVELRGVFADNAVRRAIEGALAASPVPLTAAQDRPAAARDKAVGDWREGERHPLPDEHPRWFGAEAGVEITVWGDHRDALTAELDALVRKAVESRSDLRYNYRHFPFQTSCNPFVKKDGHPQACRAARASEAAFLLGGDEAFSAMHAWLMERTTEELGDDALRGVATELGIDPDELFRTMRSPVEPAIINDVRTGGPLLYRGRIPTIYVDGRVVPRWKLGDETLVDAILDEAAAGR